MTKQHIARTGKKAGEYVACPAKNCTINSERDHVDSAVIKSTQSWLKDNGIKKRLSDIRPSDIAIFRAIPEDRQEKYIAAQEEFDKARAERLNSPEHMTKAIAQSKSSKSNANVAFVAVAEGLKAQRDAAIASKKSLHQPTYGAIEIKDDGFIIQQREYSRHERREVNECFDAYNRLSEGTIGPKEVEAIIASRATLTPADKTLLLTPLRQVKTRKGSLTTEEVKTVKNSVGYIQNDLSSGEELGTHYSYELYSHGYAVKPLGSNHDAPSMKKNMASTRESAESLRTKLNQFFEAKS